MRLLVCFFAVVALAACDEHGVDCPTEEPTVAMTLSPDTVAPGGDVEGTIVVENFELSGEAGHSHTEGVGEPPGAEPLHDDGEDEEACAGGHVHVYLDDLMTNPLTQATTAEFVITIPDDAADGMHAVIGRLHNRDHTIIKPEITTEVEITVAAP
jgi:hypothetical protein